MCKLHTLILSALAPGRHSAQTLTMASCSAIARAVRQLSPVTKCTAKPRRAKAATTPRASGLSGSVTARTATMVPDTATMIHVQQLPCRRQPAFVRRLCLSRQQQRSDTLEMTTLMYMRKLPWRQHLPPFRSL